MERSLVLRLSLIGSASLLLGVAAYGFYASWQHLYVMQEAMRESPDLTPMEEMMRRVMGPPSSHVAFIPFSGWLWALLAIGSTLLVVAIIGYFSLGGSNKRVLVAWSRGSMGLTKEEEMVVELIVKEGGKILQRDISRRLSISRLKAHRLVSSLVKRRVVITEPFGRTKLVKLVRIEEEEAEA